MASKQSEHTCMQEMHNNNGYHSNNHIYDGYKPNLIGWIVGGVLLGVWALISKKIGGSEDDAAHSAWHISIFSAAYCFSRAHSYLKILKD